MLFILCCFSVRGTLLVSAFILNRKCQPTNYTKRMGFALLRSSVLTTFAIHTPAPSALSVSRRSSMASFRMMSFTFISRIVLARSFSSSFIVIYLMFCCICGILTYSSALTRRLVRSISAAIKTVHRTVFFTGFQIPFYNFIFNQKRYYPQIRIISFPWS